MPIAGGIARTLASIYPKLPLELTPLLEIGHRHARTAVVLCG